MVAWSLAVRRSKINSSDPPLTTPVEESHAKSDEPRASVHEVNRSEEVTSVRQAASACGVSPFVLRTWISQGVLAQPPWTLEQLHAVRDAQDPGPRTQAPHGTTARWNDGCSCAACRMAHRDIARVRKRRSAQARLPIEVSSTSHDSRPSECAGAPSPPTLPGGSGPAPRPVRRGRSS